MDKAPCLKSLKMQLVCLLLLHRRQLEIYPTTNATN